VDWRARLRPLAARPNVVIVQEADASPYMAAADLLITDHSTVGFEFMVLDRPVVTLHQPALIEHARINPAKVALMQSAARVVSDRADLLNAVVGELEHPDRLSAARRRLAADFFYGYGSATDRATAVVYELLKIPAPRMKAEPEYVTQSR
jgi:CDP-glycerol glycerophosphotransferase